MGLFEAFRYDGKRAVSRRRRHRHGAAVAEVVKDAGAEAVVMDRAPVDAGRREGDLVGPVRTRRRSTPPSPSAAGRSTPCFSMPPASPKARPASRRLNFIGHRYMIDQLAGGRCVAREARRSG